MAMIAPESLKSTVVEQAQCNIVTVCVGVHKLRKIRKIISTFQALCVVNTLCLFAVDHTHTMGRCDNILATSDVPHKKSIACSLTHMSV